MDHYKTLGLSRDATKEEIKESFRRSALNFHPDRHVQSSEVVRQRSVLRFKQASEAYEVLIDDRKRADYDFSLHRGGGYDGWSGGASPASSAGYAGRGYGGGGGGGGYPRRSPGGGGSGLDVEVLLKFMTTRGFLLSLAFARFNHLRLMALIPLCPSVDLLGLEHLRAHLGRLPACGVMWDGTERVFGERVRAPFLKFSWPVDAFSRPKEATCVLASYLHFAVLKCKKDGIVLRLPRSKTS